MLRGADGPQSRHTGESRCHVFDFSILYRTRTTYTTHTQFTTWNRPENICERFSIQACASASGPRRPLQPAVMLHCRQGCRVGAGGRPWH